VNPREQGDVGERSAVAWLWSEGWAVFVPFGHAPDVDLVALRGREVLRVQVKTSTCHVQGRWSVTLATRGGNRSSSGFVKRFSAARCDALFVLVGDGRRWFLPSEAVGGGSGMLLGGPKYAAFEVARGRRIEERFATLPGARRGSEVVKRSGL
jgi:hypothetical protein